MERYRNYVRIEQMKENIRSGRTDAAIELAEQLDPSKVRSSSDLSIMADLYLENGMLVKAKSCLTELCSRKKTRGGIIKLINLSIRLKAVDEAEKYYREFRDMAPDDFYNFIFRYNIDKLKGRSFDILIESLEKLKEVEYIDCWAYELAKLYHKAGDKEKCIAECNDIVIWFGDGEYVERAKALKAYYLGELDIREAALPAKDEEPDDAGMSAEGNGKAVSENSIVGEGDTEYIEEEYSDEDFEDDIELSEEVLSAIEGVGIDAVHEILPEIGTADNRCEEISQDEDGSAEQIVDNVNEEEEQPENEPAEQLADSRNEEEEQTDNGPAEQINDNRNEAVNSGAGESDDYDEDEALILRLLKEEEENLASSVAQNEREEAEQALAEATEAVIGETETVRHTFKGLKSTVISDGSLLDEFLKKNGTELNDYFGYFAYQSDVRSQLVRTLEIILNPQVKAVCMVISGEHDSGVKRIIMGLSQVLQQNGYLERNNISMIDADRIVKSRLTSQAEKLKGCCLMIRNAGRLNKEAADELMNACSKVAGKTAVIMTDYRSEITKLFREHRDLNSIFPNRIHIPSFDKDDLEDLLFYRMQEQGFSITTQAYESLQKEMRMLLRDNSEGLLKRAEIYIDSIIDKLDTRNAASFLKGGEFGEDRLIRSEDISPVQK